MTKNMINVKMIYNWGSFNHEKKNFYRNIDHHFLYFLMFHTRKR